VRQKFLFRVPRHEDSWRRTDGPGVDKPSIEHGVLRVRTSCISSVSFSKIQTSRRCLVPILDSAFWVRSESPRLLREMHAACQAIRGQFSCAFSMAWVADGPRATSFNSRPDVERSTQARIFSTSSTTLELVHTLPTTLRLHVYSGMIPSLIQESAPETVSRTLDATIIEAGHSGSNCIPRQPTKQSVFVRKQDEN
jgi:hypothetical protein